MTKKNLAGCLGRRGQAKLSHKSFLLCLTGKKFCLSKGFWSCKATDISGLLLDVFCLLYLFGFCMWILASSASNLRLRRTVGLSSV